MKSLKFYLKLIVGSLTFLFVFNFYALPIIKNYGVYLSISGTQESAETMIERGYIRDYCSVIHHEVSIDSQHFCLKNAELMNITYSPAEEKYAIEAFYRGKYNQNIVCELKLKHNKADPYDPYTCTLVSYNKVENPNVPFEKAFSYFSNKRMKNNTVK